MAAATSSAGRFGSNIVPKPTAGIAAPCAVRTGLFWFRITKWSPTIDGTRMMARVVFDRKRKQRMADGGAADRIPCCGADCILLRLFEYPKRQLTIVRGG